MQSPLESLHWSKVLCAQWIQWVRVQGLTSLFQRATSADRHFADKNIWKHLRRVNSCILYINSQVCSGSWHFPVHYGSGDVFALLDQSRRNIWSTAKLSWDRDSRARVCRDSCRPRQWVEQIFQIQSTCIPIANLEMVTCCKLRFEWHKWLGPARLPGRRTRRRSFALCQTWSSHAEEHGTCSREVD